MTHREEPSACRNSPGSSPQPQARPRACISLLPPGLWSFSVHPCPPLERPASWHRLQEHNLSPSLCQDDLAHLQLIDWNSSGNFWVIFLKKEKHQTQLKKTLKCCSVLWVCATLEGTTCRFFFKSCQNIWLQFALTQLSARKTCCYSWFINNHLWFKSSRKSPLTPLDPLQERGACGQKGAHLTPRVSILQTAQSRTAGFIFFTLGFIPKALNRNKCLGEKTQFRKCQTTKCFYCHDESTKVLLKRMSPIPVPNI